MTTSTLAALATYASALVEASDKTTRAEERPLYDKHLAAVTRLFVALHSGSSTDELRRVLEAEKRNYGLTYLAGEEGHRAEAAFRAFARLIEGA